MNRILIPLDFSSESMHVYQFGIEYAQRIRAEVLIVHPIDVPVIQESTFGFQTFLYSQERHHKVLENALQMFEQFKEQCPSKVPVSFHPLHDDLPEGLPEFARNNDVDMIIASTAGPKGLKDFIFGSPVKKIVRNSPVPVLLLPGETKIDDLKNIVFANSLEGDQDHLIQSVIKFQQALQARLHLLFITTAANSHSENRCLALLESFALYYQLTNYTAKFRYSDSEESGIISFAEETNADVIAMGTHGRTGLAHLLQGSIAESVLAKANRPMLISRLI